MAPVIGWSECEIIAFAVEIARSLAFGNRGRGDHFNVVAEVVEVLINRVGIATGSRIHICALSSARIRSLQEALIVWSQCEILAFAVDIARFLAFGNRVRVELVNVVPEVVEVVINRAGIATGSRIHICALSSARIRCLQMAHLFWSPREIFAFAVVIALFLAFGNRFRGEPGNVVPVVVNVVFNRAGNRFVVADVPPVTAVFYFAGVSITAIRLTSPAFPIRLDLPCGAIVITRAVALTDVCSTITILVAVEAVTNRHERFPDELVVLFADTLVATFVALRGVTSLTRFSIELIDAAC